MICSAKYPYKTALNGRIDVHPLSLIPICNITDESDVDLSLTNHVFFHSIFIVGLNVAAVVLGGHINPAVTITMAVFRRLPWKKVPVYLAAQSLGSFLASACIYGVYKGSISNFCSRVCLSNI